MTRGFFCVNRNFAARNLHRDPSIQQITHDLTLDSHRARLLERLLLTRQRHFGDREILLSGLSTAVSASEVAAAASTEAGGPKLTQPQPPPFNIEVLLQQAREKIIHSEAANNGSITCSSSNQHVKQPEVPSVADVVNVVEVVIPENGESLVETEAVDAMSSEVVGTKPPPAAAAVAALPTSVISHPARQMAPLSAIISLEVSNVSEEATSNGGGHTTTSILAASASTEATTIEDEDASGAAKLQQQKKQEYQDEQEQKAAEGLTGKDSWLAVAENEAVGGDALKELEAAAAASMIPSGTTNHQHPSYHPSTKSVEEATPKLHHHHHHHHHYHHHQHTLRSQQQCQKLSICILVIFTENN